MDPLVRYYRRQASRGLDIGPIYSIPFVQRGHGLGSVMTGLFGALDTFYGVGSIQWVRKRSDLLEARRYALVARFLRVLPKILSWETKTSLNT